jgi:protoporphyrinogen oxidase
LDIAILGAGVTGLAAAHQLLKLGCAVAIYEAQPREGGLASTFHRQGFAFDFGPHEFCTDNPELVRLLQEVCGDDLLEVEKRAAQWFRGRFVRYPFGVLDVLRNVGPLLAARVACEAGWQRFKNTLRPPDGRSFERWTKARFGRTLYETYFGPYTRKVWGIDPDLLDARTASDRISVDSLWDLIVKTVKYDVLGIEDFTRVHGEFRRKFFYTRGGIGTLQQRLRAQVEALGGQFRFGRQLTGIRGEAGRARELLFADGSAASGFDRVVSTIPLPLMLRIALGGRADVLLRQNHLPFRGLILVFLRVARPRVSDYHWIYFPDADIPFQRWTEFVHFGAGMAPEGHTGLTLEIAADPGERLWDMDDVTVVGECVDHMKRLGFLSPADVIGADVVRVRHGYPKQVQGFLERANALVDVLAEEAGVVSLGRQGLFRYCNMNECIEMAIAAAPRIKAGEDAASHRQPTTWRGVGITG